MDQNTTASLELGAQFDALQQNLVPLWEFIGRPTQEEHTIVVVPSLTLDTCVSRLGAAGVRRTIFVYAVFAAAAAGPHGVCDLDGRLRRRSLIIIWILLPAVVASHAAQASVFGCAARFLVTAAYRANCSTARACCNRFANWCVTPTAPILCHTTRPISNARLSVKLGIPMYAADPRFFAFGTKSGCREIFAQEGVQHPLGHRKFAYAG